LSADYSHLQPATRALADESAEVRIGRIRQDRWITYPRAEAAQSAMKDLLTHPKRTRMSNFLLVGPTNDGKSMIVQKFWRDHPPLAASKAENGVAHIPVLKVQMPAGPDEAQFFGAILSELGFPLMPSAQVCRRQEAAVRLLRTLHACPPPTGAPPSDAIAGGAHRCKTFRLVRTVAVGTHELVSASGAHRLLAQDILGGDQPSRSPPPALVVDRIRLVLAAEQGPRAMT
jgi:hypothetical protein